MRDPYRYALAGFLLGLPFPTAGVLLEFLRSDLPFAFASVSALHGRAPLLYIIETAPLILGLLFWLMGRARERLKATLKSGAESQDAYDRFFPGSFVRLLEREGIEQLRVGDYTELDMTVMFSDIRGFTGIAASLKDRELFEFLSGYYRAITPTITSNGGIVDKFIGDAVMAVFPEAGLNAVQAARAMLAEMRAYNDFRNQAGAPSIRVGIGIHTGELVLGTIGDETRMNVTALGDTVNISARLESLTKRFFTPVILSDTVFKTLPEQERDLCREIGHARIRGRGTSLTLYEYFGGDEPELLERKRSTMPDFLRALFHMQAREFVEAHRLFAAVQQATPEDPLPVIFMNRCERGQHGPRRSESQARDARLALVIDDNPAIVRLVETALESRGWRVEGLPSSSEALRIYDRLLPDLVLLDRNFPGMDGLDAIAGIRQIQTSSAHPAPIIGITADEELGRNRAFVEAGLDRFLMKPFAPRELRAAVEEVMKGGRKR